MVRRSEFFDFDNDGWLDPYVANYVDFDLNKHKVCYGISPMPDYCSPRAYKPLADQFYRNQGDGTFVDVSSETGIDTQVGGGLGVIAEDFNGDRFADLYVANDPDENFLWMNQRGRSFKDMALESGVAANGDGKTEASMGVDVLDFDQDCDADIFVTNLVAESNTPYVYRGRDFFVDRTNRRVWL